MTLEELADRIADVRGDVKAIGVEVKAGLAEGGRAMTEVRDELRLVRQSHEDTRQRVTAAEGRIGALEEARRQAHEDARARWSPMATYFVGALSAAAGVVVSLWAMIWRHGTTMP